jgi:hypothetical protein
VEEIIPLSVGWVGEHITGVAPPVPGLSRLVTVEGHWEFLTGEIRILKSRCYGFDSCAAVLDVA